MRTIIRWSHWILLAALLLAPAARSMADVVISFGPGPRADCVTRPLYRPYYRRWRSFYSPVVVVPQPYYPHVRLIYEVRHNGSDIAQMIVSEREMLREKANEGFITPMQFEQESGYLDTLSNQLHAEIYENGGFLSEGQEQELWEQLRQSGALIAHNLTSY